MKKIILIDTNFWLIPFTLHVDIISEISKLVDFNIEYQILSNSLIELEKISKESKFSDKKAAKMALDYINKLDKQKALKIVKSLSNILVDDEIVEIASKSDIIVATQDKILADRLKETNTSVIRLRQKKKLIIV